MTYELRRLENVLTVVVTAPGGAIKTWQVFRGLRRRELSTDFLEQQVTIRGR